MTSSNLNWKPNEYGWISEGISDVHFNKMPIRIECHTRGIPNAEPAPEMDSREAGLISLLLDNINRLCEVAQKATIDYYKQVAEEAQINELLTNIANPHIWISRDVLNEEDRSNSKSLPWTFVTGFKNNEDHGTHIEFEGLEHVDTWAGG